MLRVYGARASEALEAAGDEAALLEPIGGEPGTLGAEVVHALHREGAETLTDVLMRRTMIGLGRSAGVGPDRAAAELAERYCGWDEARAEREVAAYRAYVERYRPRSGAEA
jgi:glycerol-3-phosphate dehydrogenase